MDFNIKKFLQNKIKNTKGQVEHQSIQRILSLYVKDISDNSFSFSRGVVYLQNIHPLVRIEIKKNKKAIIQKCKEQSIVLRDII